MNKGIRQANKKLNKKKNHQSEIIMTSCFCVLWDFGWDEEKIMKHLTAISGIMHECRTKSMSAVEILEEETGIELSLDGEKSYHEFAYLSEDTKVKPLTDHQYIYMIQREIRWIPTIILAALCIELHRTELWDVEELERLIIGVNELRARLGEDRRNYATYMQEKTGYYPGDMWEK